MTWRLAAIGFIMPACGHRPDESFEVPYGLLALMTIGVPLCIALLLGLFAFRRLTPFLFHCRRCDRPFHGAAHRGFPDRCPHCHSPTWNRARSA
jgi:hypothetical protein